MFLFEIYATWTTAKLFEVSVFQLVSSQFTSGTKTLWTFTANIRFNTYMTKYVRLKVTTVAEFPLTKMTYEPSTFIVWLQQMSLELRVLTKTVWAVSTWVRLCANVNINMKLQCLATFKPLPTERTVIRSSVAVYITFVWLQVAGPAETFVTQWTLVRFVSRVDSHVSG